MGFFKKKEKDVVTYPSVAKHGLCFKSLGDRKGYLILWWLVHTLPLLATIISIPVDGIKILLQPFMIITLLVLLLGFYRHYIVTRRRFKQIYGFAIFMFFLMPLDSLILSRVYLKSKSEVKYLTTLQSEKE